MQDKTKELIETYVKLHNSLMIRVYDLGITHGENEEKMQRELQSRVEELTIAEAKTDVELAKDVFGDTRPHSTE